jgi:hypothetical protein
VASVYNVSCLFRSIVQEKVSKKELQFSMPSNVSRRISDNFLAIGTAIVDDPLLMVVDGRTLLMCSIDQPRCMDYVGQVRSFFHEI